MTAPRMTTEVHVGNGFDAPHCPHCGSTMDDAPTTLDSILAASGVIASFVKVDDNGYASSQDHPRFTCLECGRISVLAIDNASVKLIAARSERDERAMAERAG